MTVDSYSILVNTSDGFEDAWNPFFELLKIHWPESVKYKIYLNTEKKTYSNPHFNIISTKVNEGMERRLTWSECLKMAIDKIETPLILYLQEDYFLKSSVNHSDILKYVHILEKDPSVKCIYLTESGAKKTSPSHIYEGMSVVAQKTKYRLSTQASLWRKDVLKSYLEDDENGWMFEIYGSIRSSKNLETFLKIDDEELEPLRYIQTGIMKGKWKGEVKYLFANNNIEVDFTERGFYEPKNRLMTKIETFKALLNEPKKLKNFF